MDFIQEFFDKYLRGMMAEYFSLYPREFSNFIYYKPNLFLFAQIKDSYDPSSLQAEEEDLKKIDPYMCKSIWGKQTEFPFKLPFMYGRAPAIAESFIYTYSFRYRNPDKIRKFLEYKYDNSYFNEIFVFEEFELFDKQNLRPNYDETPMTPLHEATKIPSFLKMDLGEFKSISLGKANKEKLEGRILRLWGRRDANKRPC